MVEIGIAVVVAVVVGLIVYVFAENSQTAPTPTSDCFRHVNPGWIVRVPRAGVLEWMEYGEGAVERNGRYFCNGHEIVFADPEPGELALMQTYRETSAAAGRAIRAQEAARTEAALLRSAYLKKWATPLASPVVYDEAR